MEYLGNELSALTFADNYYSWILKELTPYVGKVILEVGAGIGTFSSFLFLTRPDRLLLLEPSHNLLPSLERKFAQNEKVRIIENTIESLPRGLNQERVDTVVCINVLEHLKNDTLALKKIYDILVPGGTLLLYVPALPYLYGSLDLAFGHYRRYTRGELIRKVSYAGFAVLKIKYMNFFGVFSWYVGSRILQRQALTPWAIKLYDKIFVPITRGIESTLGSFLGQNLFLVGTKPECER